MSLIADRIKFKIGSMSWKTLFDLAPVSWTNFTVHFHSYPRLLFPAIFLLFAIVNILSRLHFFKLPYFLPSGQETQALKTVRNDLSTIINYSISWLTPTPSGASQILLLLRSPPGQLLNSYSHSDNPTKGFHNFCFYYLSLLSHFRIWYPHL